MIQVARSVTPETDEALRANPQRLLEYARRFQLCDHLPKEVLRNLYGQELEAAYHSFRKNKINLNKCLNVL
jgi:hypothetical protein